MANPRCVKILETSIPNDSPQLIDTKPVKNILKNIPGVLGKPTPKTSNTAKNKHGIISVGNSFNKYDKLNSNGPYIPSLYS